eukprot:CAMPEP_0204130656 /NCGR_PEP_ID=MMETSP0361-20130328/13490_1 /ASSEMBLY_ACC=CAM_ASM_000343 /TAXON_ID=268821 /ORGANISM="Scrippsiella Hangoei, Strain SHTV-5" /LENGTH=167 /DNA_ID=CAMNT_0051083277 /DNA_START=109 /DNA_END=614 /DNA_ORIENTATION=+
MSSNRRPTRKTCSPKAPAVSAASEDRLQGHAPPTLPPPGLVCRRQDTEEPSVEDAPRRGGNRPVRSTRQSFQEVSGIVVALADDGLTFGLVERNVAVEQAKGVLPHAGQDGLQSGLHTTLPPVLICPAGAQVHDELARPVRGAAGGGDAEDDAEGDEGEAAGATRTP